MFGFMKLSALIITELKNLSAASRLQVQSQQQQMQAQLSPTPVGIRPAGTGSAAAGGTNVAPMETVPVAMK